MKQRDIGFYGGLLTALIVIKAFDQPTITEEIMGTLNEESKREFIKFAKDNGEFELAGLDEYVAQNESTQHGVQLTDGGLRVLDGDSQPATIGNSRKPLAR